MCIARSCITNGALHLIVKSVALLANPLPASDVLMALDPGRVEDVGVRNWYVSSRLVFPVR